MIWKDVWQHGFLPQFSMEHVTALLRALESDDPRLLQGATCR